ncbi:unnamed protein product [Ectocarpus sp. 12 AP-2014]
MYPAPMFADPRTTCAILDVVHVPRCICICTTLRVFHCACCRVYLCIALVRRLLRYLTFVNILLPAYRPCGTCKQAKCLAFVYDSCAANLKSIRTAIIPMFFRGAHGLQCMSHLCQNIGDQRSTRLITLAHMCFHIPPACTHLVATDD